MLEKIKLLPFYLNLKIEVDKLFYIVQNSRYQLVHLQHCSTAALQARLDREVEDKLGFTSRNLPVRPGQERLQKYFPQ